MMTNVTLCALGGIQKIKHLLLLNFMFNKSKEEQVLGITVDNKLIFKNHIKILRKKVTKFLKVISLTIGFDRLLQTNNDNL